MNEKTNNKINIVRPRCEYSDHPIGIDIKKPRFSWEITCESWGVMQSAYQLLVHEMSTTGDECLVWDTGKISSSESIHCEYSGKTLKSGTRYYWNVRIWDENDEMSQWSETAFFETGLFYQEDWKAKWIEPQLQEKSHQLQPCPFLRKEFNIRGKVTRAMVYATAHGLYSLEINGQKVSDDEFTPDFTAYDKYLQYQTYDVTALLQPGVNAVGAILADGWYRGRIGLPGKQNQYGSKLGLLLQIVLEYEDGNTELVSSDEGFKSSIGPYVYSDIFIGEKFDARLEKCGWSNAGYEEDDWLPVVTKDYNRECLKAQYGEPVKAVEEIIPIRIIKTPAGETVIDMGQNIVGRLRFRVKGVKGTEIILEHSEVLNTKGNFFNNIMGKNKDQKDIYILKGDGVEEYEPRFTYHGFRYVRITGYPSELVIENFKGVVLYSCLNKSGRFSCSNPLINRLNSNIVWSQKGNFLSIPTDCPQRERVGWIGDAQIFAPTACFNMDSSLFLTRWLRNLKLEQLENGEVPSVVPYIPSYKEFFRKLHFGNSSASWGDACIIIPWVLYQVYGDIRILHEQYSTMVRWMDYVEKSASGKSPLSFKLNPVHWRNQQKLKNQKYLWNTGFHFGDWLLPSKNKGPLGMLNTAYSTKRTVASAFFAYSTGLMAKIASVIGLAEDEKKYLNLNTKIKQAFVDEYIDKNGRLTPHLQGIYVLALHFDLVPDELRERTLGHLKELIINNGYRLDTGFVSIPYLMDVLCTNGLKDIAYKLLSQKECPSWLYEVEKGATTVWEAWDAVKPNGETTPFSYNHYAFGCIGDWLYRNMAGLSLGSPGYKNILLKPEPYGDIDFAFAEYRSMYGLISIEWKLTSGMLTVKAKIPANTRATIVLPNASMNDIKESGTFLTQQKDFYKTEKSGNHVIVKVGSGTYDFEYPYNSCIIREP